MVDIEISYEGELRCRAVHEPSAFELVTDAPVDNCGRGQSFSPTDLVATALGTCVLTMMGIVAHRHDWDITGVRGAVRKHMVADPQRRIERLVVKVTGGAQLYADARKVLERAALTCPVNESLGERIIREFCFEWDVTP